MNRSKAMKYGACVGASYCERGSRLRITSLSIGLSAALASPLVLLMPASAGSATQSLPSMQPRFSVSARQTPPSQPKLQSTWLVQNCDDDGVGSLRHIIATVAHTNDIVDLSQLACSTITLTSGAIAVAQDDLTLIGPDATHGSLSISGNDRYRVFYHSGVGQLGIESLTITRGYEHRAGSAAGGCISSDGSVYLIRATVTQCKVVSDTQFALGGGVNANADVTLVLSAVSDNDAIAPAGAGDGGGVRAERIFAKYSSISGNVAHAGLLAAVGGGAYSVGYMRLDRSTIGNNIATSAGGLFSGGGFLGVCTLSIANSTISGNVADVVPAIDSERSDPSCSASISNTTIAFNHANLDTSYGALYFAGLPNSTLSLQSSIVAGNTRGASNTPSDLYIEQGTLTGGDNLVVTTNQSPPNVIKVTADPKLGPLQFNGGWTRTHALLPGSPAIGMGNNSATQLYDQRGIGYPRTTGAAASTDIGAFQFDSIFADQFD